MTEPNSPESLKSDTEEKNSSDRETQQSAKADIPVLEQDEETSDESHLSTQENDTSVTHAEVDSADYALDNTTSENDMSNSKISQSADQLTKAEVPRKIPTGIAKLAILNGVLLLVIVIIIFFSWQQKQALNTLSATVNQLHEKTSTIADDKQRVAILVNQQETQIKNIEADVKSTQSGINGVENKLSNTTQQMNTLRSQQETSLQQQQTILSEHTKRLENFQQQLTGQQNKVNSLAVSNKEDWLLAETEYLLKLANQRVLLEQNPGNAIALLQQADTIIHQVAKNLGDHQIFNIRKSISQELAALKALPQIDKEGLYLKLNAIANSVSDLPLQLESSLEQQDDIDIQNPENSGYFSRITQKVKNSLTQLWRESFVISRKSEATLKVDKPHELLLMQLNIQLLIEQAQLSLIKQDEALYQKALTQALELLQHYNIDQAAAQAIQLELTDMLNLPVRNDMPDISASLKLLGRYMLERSTPQIKG